MKDILDSATQPNPVRALAWLRASERRSGGIPAYAGEAMGDPGVTGALLSTLFRNGDQTMAVRCAEWLVRIQHEDGSYSIIDSQDSPFVVTTSALRGLLAVRQFVPATMEAVGSAADFIFRELLKKTSDGDVFPNASISTSGQLSALCALVDSSDVLHRPDFRSFAEHCVKQFSLQYAWIHRSTDDSSNELDALIHLDQLSLVRRMLTGLGERQRNDGSVFTRSRARWVSSAGLAHLALIWQKLGQYDRVEKALAWLERHQKPFGGFKAGYGWSTPSRFRRESAWSIKWYLDAHYLRLLSFMEREVTRSQIAHDDGRLQAILRLIGSGDRVVEVGCGRGRYLTAIREVYADVHCTGADIVPALMANIPSEIQTMEGALESVPSPDNSFDVVFSVEALEHSPNFPAAIRELSRITRPGGWLAIIDKERGKWGRFECPSWEHWPVAGDLARLFEQYCEDVSYEPVGYDGRPPDGLMMIWKGRKRRDLP